MKRFIVDSVIDKDNICNLEEETRIINLGVKKGLKMLIYGKEILEKHLWLTMLLRSNGYRRTLLVSS